jgi:hypothetical protein
MLTLALGAVLAAAAAGEDVRSSLARLDAPSSSERVEAERWLAGHLEPGDLALVAEAAKQGGLEVRTRLTRALGSDERHFELAALLYAELDPDLGAIGGEALATMSARWFGSADLQPRQGDKAIRELDSRLVASVALRWADEDADLVLDRLARFAPDLGPPSAPRDTLGIVVDPALYADIVDGTRKPPAIESAGSEWIEGSFGAALRDAISRHRLGWEVFGIPGDHPWIRVALRPDFDRTSGARLLLDWCREVLQYPDRPRGEGAALALAATSWPAPLEWFESRWRKLGDANALAGLELAAGRGLVHPGLATASAVDALLAEVEARKDDPRRRDRAIRALASLPRYGSDGADLVQRTLSRVDRTNGDGAWLAATIVAGVGSAPQPYLDELRAGLVSPQQPLREQLAAVRALAACRARPPAAWTLPASPALLAQITDDRGEARFVGWAEMLSLAPDTASRAAEATATLDDASYLLLLEWTSTSDPASAAQLLERWIATGRPEAALGTRLAERVRRGDRARVARILELASRGAPPEKLSRLRLLAGVASEQEIAAFVEKTSAAPQVGYDDWPLVGAVAGAPGGEPLAELLMSHARRVVAVDLSLESPWIAAYARALIGLAERGDDRLEAKMHRELLVALRPSRSEGRTRAHPLKHEIDESRWPPQPGPPPRSLEAMEMP